MIKTSELYEMLLDAIRADERGLAIECDSFNRSLKIINQEVYDLYISKFEESTQVTNDLGGLKVFNASVALATVNGTQVGSLPLDYYYLIGKPRITSDNTSLGVVRRCDLVTTLEDAEREDDYLTMASQTYPTCMIGGVDVLGNLRILVRPSTVTNVWVDYLREVNVPYLDYILNNSTYVKTFLSESITPQSVPMGYIHSAGTVGGTGVMVTSLTKDLEWHIADAPMLIAKLVKKMGISIPDEILVQSGMTEEIKLESK